MNKYITNTTISRASGQGDNDVDGNCLLGHVARRLDHVDTVH